MLAKSIPLSIISFYNELATIHLLINYIIIYYMFIYIASRVLVLCIKYVLLYVVHVIIVIDYRL